MYLCAAYRDKLLTGVEQQNGNIDDDDEAAALNADVEAVQDPSGIYANTALTRSIKVGDLAAYVEDKKRHNGFQKEFAVSVLAY